MRSPQKLLNRKNIDIAFDITLVVKGFYAIIEILGGILIFFISKAFITSLVLSITQAELSEDPNDYIAHYVVKVAEQLSVSSQHFIAFYLLSHGIIKLFLILNLYKGKLWAYPASISIFTLFIVYQLARFVSTHSMWLLLLTLFDLVFIWLTYREYIYRKA